MGKIILEFCLGAFAGVIALMALAYMSVEVLGAGPVSLQQLAEEEPQIMPAQYDLSTLTALRSF